MDGFETPMSVGGGGRYDALASDGRTTYPGVGSRSASPAPSCPLISRGVLSADRAVPSRGPRRARRRGVPRRRASDRRTLRAPGIPTEVAAAAAEVRPADPVRRAARHPLRLVPRGRRRPTRSRTSAAATRPTPTPTLDPARRRPSSAHGHTRSTSRPASRPPRRDTRDPHPRRRQPCAPTTSARPSPWPAGSPGDATTAASPSSTCATPAGVAQVVIRDEEVAHPLRSEFCLKVIGEVRPRPGQRQPQPAHRRDRGRSRRRVEVLSESAPLPFPIDEHARRSARRCGSSTATSTCAEPAWPRIRLRSRGEPGRPRRAARRSAFVEIETPTLTRSTPRAPATSWFRPGCSRQLVRAAAVPRSCSSSC